MSVFDKFWAVDGGISDITNPALWLQNAMAGTGKSSAGVTVTSETAMSLSAYYACLRNVSEDIAGLPFKIFKLLHPGREPAPTHSVFPIIHDTPNNEMSSMTFWEILIHWAMGWGDGYAEIVKTPAGRVVEMILIHPSRIIIKRDRVTGEIVYEVHNDDGTTVGLRASEVFHLRGLGDQWNGYSVARIGAESLGRAIATQEYSGRFFGQGSTFSGVYKTAGKLDKDARQRLKETWPTGLPSAFNPLFLEGGMEWQKMSVDPNEAQMVETMQFTVVDVARWFRMPPHKIQSMEAATFSNIQHQAIEYVQDALIPWINRIEAETQRKLLKPADKGKFEAKHVIRALLRGDMAQQASFYSSMTNIGAMSINEVREFEGMNPVEGGDEHRVQLNTGSMAESSEKEDEPEEDDNEQEGRRRQVRGMKKASARVFADVAERLATKETKALQRASKRYSDDENGFAKWAFTFYGDHKKHITESLRQPSLALAESICVIMHIDVLPAVVADAVEDVIQWTAASIVTKEEALQRIEWNEQAGPRAAEKMPDRIEAVVYRAIGVSDEECV